MIRINFAFLLIVSVSILHSFSVITAVHAREEVIVNKGSGEEYSEGLSLLNAKEYSQAVEHFQRAYELDNRNINALFAHGLALSEMKKFREAAVKFQLVLDKDRMHEKALKMLPTVLADAGESEKAIAAYDKGIETMPENHFFYWGKAVEYIKLNRFEDAVPLLIMAAEKAPQRIEIQEKLAYVYRESGRLDESYSIALSIMEKNKNNVHARIIVGDYKRLTGKLDEALMDYEIAAKDIETKAYAGHFIEVINQKLEEMEIEKEYLSQLAASDSAEKNEPSAVIPEIETDTASPVSEASNVYPEEKSGGVLILLILAVSGIVFVVAAVRISLRKRSY